MRCDEILADTWWPWFNKSVLCLQSHWCSIPPEHSLIQWTLQVVPSSSGLQALLDESDMQVLRAGLDRTMRTLTEMLKATRALSEASAGQTEVVSSAVSISAAILYIQRFG